MQSSLLSTSKHKSFQNTAARKIRTASREKHFLLMTFMYERGSHIDHYIIQSHSGGWAAQCLCTSRSFFPGESRFISLFGSLLLSSQVWDSGRVGGRVSTTSHGGVLVLGRLDRWLSDKSMGRHDSLYKYMSSLSLDIDKKPYLNAKLSCRCVAKL